MSLDGNYQRKWSTRAAQAIERVEQNLGKGILMSVRDLFNTLGLELIEKNDFARLVIASYNLAKAKNNWSWVEKAQVESIKHFEKQWILNNLPHKYKNMNKVSVSKQRFVQPKRDERTPYRDTKYYENRSSANVPDKGLHERRVSESEKRNLSFSKQETNDLQPGFLPPKQMAVTIDVQPGRVSATDIGGLKPGCRSWGIHDTDAHRYENYSGYQKSGERMERGVAEDSSSGLFHQVSLNARQPHHSRHNARVTGFRSMGKHNTDTSHHENSLGYQKSGATINKNVAPATNRESSSSIFSQQVSLNSPQHSGSEQDIPVTRCSPRGKHDTDANCHENYLGCQKSGETIKRSVALPNGEDSSSRLSQQVNGGRAKCRNYSFYSPIDEVPLNAPEPSRSEQDVHITGSYCPYVGCETMTRSLRSHMTRAHLPRLFNDDVSSRVLADSSFHARRLEAVGVLRRWLLGCDGPIEGLMDVVRDSPCLKGSCLVTGRAAKGMAALCSYMGWKIPDKFSLKPLNSPACLIHWRCLVAALNQVTEKQRNEFFARYKGSLLGKKAKGDKTSSLQGSETKSVNKVNAEDSTKNVCQTFVFNPTIDTSARPPMGKMEIDTVKVKFQAIDAHIWLDRLMEKFGGSLTSVYALSDALSLNLPILPVNPVEIVGAVTVYSDPLQFPQLLPLDPRLKIAIGVHPKKVQQLTSAVEHNFCTLFANPRVSALGEIGLDLTEPPDSWVNQERAFCNFLSYSCVKKPVILSLKGNESAEGMMLYSRALTIVRQYCAPLQPIHLHCFSGRVEDVQGWLGAFPHCYFGLTALVSSFSREQSLGLSLIPNDRILLESNAPCIPTNKGLNFSTPAFLGDVGEAVAQKIGMEYRELMCCALENAKRLYKFP